MSESIAIAGKSVKLFKGHYTRETTRERILVAIKANPTATALELSKLLNLTAKGVEWNLRKLKNEGLLKRVGPDFGGHWEVLPK